MTGRRRRGQHCAIVRRNWGKVRAGRAAGSTYRCPPRGPFDRIIAATARELGATLITRDRALLAYGEQGHVSVVGC